MGTYITNIGLLATEVRTFDNTGSQVARAASDGFTVMVAC